MTLLLKMFNPPREISKHSRTIFYRSVSLLHCKQIHIFISTIISTNYFTNVQNLISTFLVQQIISTNYFTNV